MSGDINWVHVWLTKALVELGAMCLGFLLMAIILGVAAYFIYFREKD